MFLKPREVVQLIALYTTSITLPTKLYNTDDPKKGHWALDRQSYMCLDGLQVQIRSSARKMIGPRMGRPITGPGIAYNPQKKLPRLVLYEIELSRNCDRLIKVRPNEGTTPKKQYAHITKTISRPPTEVIGLHALMKFGIEEFVLPPTLKSIEEGAFYNCKSLKRVVLNKGIKEIGVPPDCRSMEVHGAFENCPLRTIELPGSLRKLGTRTFYNCPLMSVELPRFLEEIGNSAFAKTRIQEVVIPGAVAKIGKDAFESCPELKTIFFEPFVDMQHSQICEKYKLQEIGEGAFNGISSGNDARPAVMFYSEKLDEELVSRLGEINGIEKIALPSQSTMVGHERLQDLRARARVELPEGLPEILAGQFAGSEIETIVIPSSVRSIQKNAFAFCRNLKHIVFRGNSQLQTIGPQAFMASGLEKFSAPRTLTRIGEMAFYGCEQLKSVELNNSLTEIPLGCFKKAGILRITIPNQIEVIGDRAFEDCSLLEQVILTENSRLEKLGVFAFSHTKLEAFQAPHSLQEIGQGAFANCEELANVQLNKGLRYLGESFLKQTSVKTLFVPSSVESPQNALYYCGTKKVKLIYNEAVPENTEVSSSYASSVDLDSQSEYNDDPLPTKEKSVLEEEGPQDETQFRHEEPVWSK